MEAEVVAQAPLNFLELVLAQDTIVDKHGRKP